MHALAAPTPAVLPASASAVERSGSGSARESLAAGESSQRERGSSGPASPDLVAALNRTHDMAGLRARGGAIVVAIEDRRRRLVSSRVLGLRPDVVVDVGCEDGWIAEAYAGSVRETVLVDLDPVMLERARARRLPRARTVVGDATEAGLVPAGSADVVVMSAILEHLTHPEEALAAWVPAVRRGGHLVVYVPADRPILAMKRVLRRARLGGLVRGLSLEPAPGHVVTFGRRSLVRLLSAFGAVESFSFDPIALGYAATVRVRTS